MTYPSGWRDLIGVGVVYPVFVADGWRVGALEEVGIGPALKCQLGLG